MMAPHTKFEVLSTGETSARTGLLTLGDRVIKTPVVWFGHSLKSHVRVSRHVSAADAVPILLNFAELRNNSAALDRARLHGLHRAFGHDGPILLDSGGYQFQRSASIDISPKDLVEFYAECRADIAVALDHPLSPVASRAANMRRWHRSLDNLAMMRRVDAPYLFMPVVHGHTLRQIEQCCKRIAALVGTPCAIGIGSMVPLLKASHIGGRFCYRRENGSIGSHVDFVADAISKVRVAFPNSMLHIFGAGGVPTLLALFAVGADSCDSSAWRLKAAFGAIQLPGTSDRFLRNGCISSRTRRVVDATDIVAIEECDCPACESTGTIAARRTLLKKSFSARASHNAHVIIREIGALRTAVAAGRDREWLIGRLARSHRFSRLILPGPAQ